MNKKVYPVSAADAPAAIGPYSQAICCGHFIFLSGQLAIDPMTGVFLGGGVEQQTEQIFKNISAVLKAEGIGLGKVVKTTVFLKNMDDFARMNEVYAKFMKYPYPARATVEVARLPKDALVEIEAIAFGMKQESETTL